MVNPQVQTDFQNESKQTSAASGVRVNPGIYFARVTNNIDPGRMGQVAVSILSSGKSGSTPGDQEQTVNVRSAVMYSGQLPYSGLTKNDQYDYNQQSYGFVARPPDIGTMCLVAFTEGGDGRGYIIGYVPDEFMNANTFNNFEAEYNKKTPPGYKNDPDTNERQLNEKGPFKGNSSFSAGLYDNRIKLEKVNGYWADPDRGPQTSGPRRDPISMVQGWSSPGPYKYDGPKLAKTPEPVGEVRNELPFSRLGGTNLIMDDGNPGLYRTTLAKDGKREYVPAPGGERTIPHSEQFRIETRTGHKIIMHNSEDFITIIHSNGDSWMEFTANGKIDVYSRGGISMATEKDEKAGINFHAHQFNIDVDELNISAKTAINIEQRSNPEAEPNFALKVKEGKLDILSTTGLDIENRIHDGTSVTDEATFKLKHNYDLKSLELLAGDIPAEVSSDNKFVAFAYDHAEEKFEINAPKARLESKITDATTALVNGSAQSSPHGTFQFEEMPKMIHDMPASYTKIDEEKTKYSDHDTLKTPLGRVPRKQPWRHAENLDPALYMPDSILYGVEKVLDSEPVYAKSTISDTGIAAKKIHEERGGY